MPPTLDGDTRLTYEEAPWVETRCRLVSEAVPAPSVFDHGVVGEQGRAGARDPLDRVL